MAIDDKIRDKKRQYNINRDAGKIPALSSEKNDEYKYLTGEEILPTDQRRVIEQAKFTYSSLGKALEKQTKTIKNQGTKQIQVLKILNFANEEELSNKSFIPNNQLNPEIVNELKRFEKVEEKLIGKKMFYKGYRKAYGFRKDKKNASFGDDIKMVT